MKTPFIQVGAELRLTHQPGPGLREALAPLARQTAASLFGGELPPGLELLPIGPAPCSQACPVGINVKRYVGLVAEARFEEALAVVRRDNPMAAVCGFLCARPCELDCALRSSPEGGPIPIRALKQMAARVVADSGAPPALPADLVEASGGRVAVVGGGPSGLTAARDLRLLGHRVTILEARQELGGLLAREVPEERLPRWALAADIEYVLAHGVEVRLGVSLSEMAELDALLAEGFDAVLLAIGAGRELGCGLPGEGDSEAVRSALALLREMADGRAPGFGRAVILGGTAVAFAAATALARTGTGDVLLLFGRGERELPVDPVVRAEAEDAGVEIRFQQRAQEIEVSDGMVLGVVVNRALERGRTAGRGEYALAGSEILEADLVVTGGDREPVLEGLCKGAGLTRSPLGYLAIDQQTMATGKARVFGTGEAVSGPRGVIEAVALGRRAARAVAGAISGGSGPAAQAPPKGIRLGSDRRDHSSGWVHLLREGDPRDETPFGPLAQAARSPAGELEPAALAAARRCLRCGPCSDCATCSAYCPESLHADREGTLLRASGQVSGELRGLAEPVAARVDARRCRACGLCEEQCPYSAPRIITRANGRMLSTVDPLSCRGCGLCVGLCPTEALSVGHFDNPHLAAAVDSLLLPLEEEV